MYMDKITKIRVNYKLYVFIAPHYLLLLLWALFSDASVALLWYFLKDFVLENSTW